MWFMNHPSQIEFVNHTKLAKLNDCIGNIIRLGFDFKIYSSVSQVPYKTILLIH